MPQCRSQWWPPWDACGIEACAADEEIVALGDGGLVDRRHRQPGRFGPNGGRARGRQRQPPQKMREALFMIPPCRRAGGRSRIHRVGERDAEIVVLYREPYPRIGGHFCQTGWAQPHHRRIPCRHPSRPRLNGNEPSSGACVVLGEPARLRFKPGPYWKGPKESRPKPPPAVFRILASSRPGMGLSFTSVRGPSGNSRLISAAAPALSRGAQLAQKSTGGSWLR
jgi:hypothetical protein